MSNIGNDIRSQTEGKCFFILSCARSGSTSLARILDTAENAICAIEPIPNLNYETREMMEGRLTNPVSILNKTIIDRVIKNIKKTEIYGEKNVTYGPFVSYLHEILGCKFVFLKRDGRDVVRSLMDWHEQVFGNIYRECKTPGNLSPKAVLSAANLPIHKDMSDYSRPRPLPGTPYYNEWDDLTRGEMCTYYWSFINNLYLSELEKIPHENWVEINYTSVAVDDILKVADFLGLKGLKRGNITKMLNLNINSLQNRFKQEKSYPNWENWDSGSRRQFDKIASKLMIHLGYYSLNGLDWCPENYGKIWVSSTKGDIAEFYTWMYNSRFKMHKDMVKWVNEKDADGDNIESIADFGCGIGVGYCYDFADKHYVGLDLSSKNIQWCKENRKKPNHRYLNIDFIVKPLDEKFDLVFSSGTIDNSYDIDEFLKAMVRNSKKWIYLTCYRGWFPYLDEHKYTWNEEHKCFYNDISPSRIHDILTSLGCSKIRIEPIETNKDDIAFETLIIAHVPKGGEEI